MDFTRWIKDKHKENPSPVDPSSFERERLKKEEIVSFNFLKSRFKKEEMISFNLFKKTLSPKKFFQKQSPVLLRDLPMESTRWKKYEYNCNFPPFKITK